MTQNRISELIHAGVTPRVLQDAMSYGGVPDLARKARATEAELDTLIKRWPVQTRGYKKEDRCNTKNS